MRDGFGQGQSLDPLGSPGRGDLLAGHTPYFFGIALEEGAIELAPEAVDEEVFEGLLRLALKQVRLDVTESDANGAQQSQALESIGGERQGVIEERAHEVDAAFAGAHEEDAVGIFGDGGPGLGATIFPAGEAYGALLV